ncbi:MAG: ABC transporter substrate-binding protein [Deltaproteobacteria bacterium]|nr:ABC transporter substrate-binding protein [Deltaproteobacteria bacterium]
MKKAMIGMSMIVLWCASLFVVPFLAYGDEVNIGVIMPLTGKVAAVGIDTLHGAQIAAKEINDEGGLNVGGKNYMITIRQYDDEASAAKAVAGMQLLKDRYNVRVVIQGLSGPTMACLEKNERLGVLIIGFFKAPEATTRGNKLVLRHQQTADDDARDCARAAVKILKAKTYALISDTSDWGKASAEGYEDVFEKLGVKKVASEWFDERTQTDFRGQLTKIKAAKPDVIMLTGHDESSAGVITQAHELGIKTPFVVTTGFGVTGEKLTGPKLIEGYLRRIEFTSKTPWPPANARYRTQLYPAMGFKEPAAGYGLSSYASVHIIARAMQKAGTITDALKIRQAVPSVVPLPEKYNTTGVTGFLENGTGIITGEMGVYRDGKLVPMK